MTVQKETLNKLVLFIRDIARDPDNKWVVDQILTDFGNKQSPNIIDPEITKDILSDIKRTRYYLKSIDKSIHNEAINYYSNIKDTSLKNKLVVDYKEMRSADKQDDLLEYARRLVLQLENLLNWTCQKLDAHQQIINNPNKYQAPNIDLNSGPYSFFDTKGNKKSLKKIDISVKINFCKLHFNINYNFYLMNELVLIRNAASHRGILDQKELIKIENVILKQHERKCAYFSLFDSFWRKINII